MEVTEVAPSAPPAPPAPPAQVNELITQVLSQDGGLEALNNTVKELTAAATAKASAMKMTKVESEEEAVCTSILQKYNLVRVLGMKERGAIYYGEYADMDGVRQSPLYRPLDTNTRDNMVKEAYNEKYKRLPGAQKIARYGETLEAWVSEERNGLNSDIIMIKDGIYWDLEDQRFVNYPGEGGCFRRLFDSPPGADIRVDPNEIVAPLIKPRFNQVLSHLNGHDGKIIPNELLPPGEQDEDGVSLNSPVAKAFWVWANEDLDTFNDLLKAVAVNFFQVKPKGSFILIGKTRNGKSSFIKMLHTLFGTNNTSEVTLAQLDDSHMNMPLLTTMLNAPDEEEEGKSQEVLKAQSRFKMMATHKSILLPVFYSQEPQMVPTNFMSYHAMNDIPQWQGSGAEACMKRSIVIMFDNDLSKMDNNGRDFEKETYNGYFFTELLGIVLAISRYHRYHTLEFSETQRQKKQIIAGEVDNMSVYLTRFFHWFPGGYSTANLVWEDYKMWCDERGYRWTGKQAFSAKLKVYGGTHSRLTLKDPNGSLGDPSPCSNVIDITRLKKGAPVFYAEAPVEELGGYTVSEIICGEPQEQYSKKTPRRARSVIGWLDANNPDEVDLTTPEPEPREEEGALWT